MRVLIAGATGLIGTALVQFLGSTGHEVRRLVRGERVEDSDISWDPAHGGVSPSSFEGFDAAVCLSGAGIADERWSPARKALLRDSRVETLALMARTLAKCEAKPECLICASATGFYGADRGAEVLTDDSPAGTDFLARLCREWEDAATPAMAAGIRVAHIRFGIVLSSEGGALKKMLLPFRLGLGGKIGSGRQYMSWLTLDDAIGIVDYAIQMETIAGSVNAVAPYPVTNEEFTRALGAALHRPAVARVPAIILRAAMGEMSGLLLGSSRVYPRRLEATGFGFRHPMIDEALRDILAA